MKNIEIELLRKLAQSWNNLEIRYIEHSLSEDFIYESQWVLRPLVGRKNFLIYLHSKFSTIKKAMCSQAIAISAELAFYRDALDDRPCIVLIQKTNESVRRLTVLIEIAGDKIKRIDICFIPDPLLATLTGEMPK